MPRLTADEAEKWGFHNRPEVTVSDEDYMRRRNERIENAQNPEEMAEIEREMPSLWAVAEREAEEERESRVYEGSGRDLSSEEKREYHKALDAAESREAAIDVHRQFGQLDPNWERENSY